MSPEDNLVTLGPESQTGDICTPATGLCRPGKEVLDTSHRGNLAGVSSQEHSRAQKGQPPKAPATGPPAQGGREGGPSGRWCPCSGGLSLHGQEAIHFRALGLQQCHWDHFHILDPVPSPRRQFLGSWSALLSTAIKRAFAPYHFSKELACLSGYKEIMWEGKCGVMSTSLT